MSKKRPWSGGHVAKLKNLAGKMPSEQIAAELDRTEAAAIFAASKLGLSLRTRWKGGKPVKAESETAGSN